MQNTGLSIRHMFVKKYVQLNSNTPVSFSYSLSVDGCYNTMITDQEDA